MGVRLLILVAIAGGLAVYFAVPKKPAAQTIEEDDVTYLGADDGLERPKELETLQKTVCDQPISGKEPNEDPVFFADVEVDTSMGKNRLYFNISEAHGWYGDGFQLKVWWVEDGVTDAEDSPLKFVVLINNYLKANETLRVCTEVVPAELSSVGGDIGDTENWAVEVIHYCRAREQNPDVFPLISEAGRCY